MDQKNTSGSDLHPKDTIKGKADPNPVVQLIFSGVFFCLCLMLFQISRNVYIQSKQQDIPPPSALEFYLRQVHTDGTMPEQALKILDQYKLADRYLENFSGLLVAGTAFTLMLLGLYMLALLLRIKDGIKDGKKTVSAPSE